MPNTCECPKPCWIWRLASCNESGWTCTICNMKAPGDPPGYRPDLDRKEVKEKVRAVLMTMHETDLIYVSNSDHGEGIIGSVARACIKAGMFAQSSIIHRIIGGMDDGKSWKEQASRIEAGNDSRERCHCGALATSFRVQGSGKPSIGTCSEHSDFLAFLKADPIPPGTPEPPDPWQVFGEWAERWRDEHPDDDRDDLDLVDEYAKVEAHS